MLSLPDVTLVMIETREHELAAMATEDCCAKAKFGDLVIFTNNLQPFDRLDFDRVVSVPDWPDKIGWSKCLWNDVALHVKTSHLLVIQWDSWIVDPSMWRDEFLQYDYVGAPWWYKDGKNVGNGGFSLRSTALMRYVRAHRDTFPCITPTDDDLLCRKYRPALQDLGFDWATEDVAKDFAFECVHHQPTFGFHGMFNWQHALDKDALLARARIAAQSKYIKGSYMWNSFCKASPEVVALLEAEDEKRSGAL